MVLRSTSNIRERARLRALPVALLIWIAAQLALASLASGHATVQPSASRPADLQIYTLTVPTERPAGTSSVSLKVPAGIDFLLVRPAPGWKVRAERRGGRIAVIRWTGGRIPADSYDQFQFIVRNPVRQGPLDWKVIQGYADGKTVRWVGAPDSDSPASRTQLSERAMSVNVVSVHGERSSGPTAPATSTSSTAARQDDSDSGLALVLAIVGSTVGVIAMVIAILGTRQRRKVLVGTSE